MPSLSELDLIGFALTYPSGNRIAPHAHEAHQLVHAISGSMRVSALRRVWILPVGRAIWIPAGIEHSIHCRGDVAMRTAYLSPAYPTLPGDLRVISVTPMAREILVRLATRPHDPLRHTLGDVLIHEIASGQAEPFSLPLPSDARIAVLAEAMRGDPANNRTVTDWARHLGFSERSLIRRIRQDTGMTFRELRRQTRIMIAIEKLIDGQSVTSVALDVGFETPSAFIAAFRAITGQTPHQFKVSH